MTAQILDGKSGGVMVRASIGGAKLSGLKVAAFTRGGWR